MSSESKSISLMKSKKDIVQRNIEENMFGEILSRL